MGWCNQSTSVKSFFKHIDKGYDRITATIVPKYFDGTFGDIDVDKIKQYLDYRFFSPSEAYWSLYSFPTHGRSPTVERLFFHLEGENFVYYNDYGVIGEILENSSVKESTFTSWMEANKTYLEAKNLTYSKFISKFVYDKRYRHWRSCKRGYIIGILLWVPPSKWELYYLRIMLTLIRGLTFYKDIKYVSGKVCGSFRVACFEMEFIEDDNEYVATIEEEKDWGSGPFLRNLFVTMHLLSIINRPCKVWERTWVWLCDGIFYEQRKKSNNKGNWVLYFW